MTRAAAALALAAAGLGLGAGCKGERSTTSTDPRPPTASSDAAPAPAKTDLRFVLARAAVSRTPLPARYSAPLPVSIEGVRGTGRPPDAYIEAALAADTADMRARMLAALTRAAEAGPITDQLAFWYVSRFGYAADAATCRWIAEVATGTAPAAVRDVMWQALVRCADGAAVAPLLASEGAPDPVIVDWYFDHNHDGLAFNPRAAAAAAAVARTSPDDFAVRKVGFVFAAMAGDESVAAMVALQKSLDPKRRALAGIGMLNSTSTAGRAIGKAACKHPATRHDAMCDRPERRQRPTPDRRPAIEDAIADVALPAATLLARFPRDKVIAAATRCAKAGAYTAWDCLHRLAELDRPAAVALAPAVAAAGNEAVAAAVRSLVAFPEDGAIERELTRLGFTLDPAAADPRWPALTIDELLEARGRSTRFDTETGTFPNQHDALLAELAHLARPALDDVVFEEVAPPEDQMDTGKYQLRAYAGGMRYAVDAANNGDWYDVDAVVGLLNALLVARSHPSRFAVLPTGDQTAIVIAGPGAGILDLADRHLIELADPSSAMTAGKDFEDEVFDQLQGSGK